MAPVVDLEPIRSMLVGATVRSLGRASSMGILELIGTHGEDIGVHLQCPFRVQRQDAVVVGARDMNFPAKGASRATAFDAFETMFDDRAGRLTAILGHRRPVVEDVAVSAFGDLMISWTPDYALSAFIEISGRIESWRVLVKGGEHHVFPVEA